MSSPRADKLVHNLEKLGAANVNVMRTDARRLDEFFSFDQILLAPRARARARFGQAMNAPRSA